METKTSVQKIFAAVTGGVLLTAALGLAPDIVRAEVPSTATQTDAVTLAQQSAEIAAFFEDINGRDISFTGADFWKEGDLRPDMNEYFDMLKNNKWLVTDRVFRAWEQMTRHWHKNIKNLAIIHAGIFNGAKKEYTQYLLQHQATEWALSNDDRVRWATTNTIFRVAQDYPDLLPDVEEIMNAQVRSRDSDVREDAAQNAETIGTYHASSRPAMFDLLQRMVEDSNERVRWVALYHMQNLIKVYKPGEMKQETAEYLFETIQDIPLTDMSVNTAIHLAEKSPSLLKPLMEMGKEALAVEIKGTDLYEKRDLKSAGLWAVSTAGKGASAFLDDAYETILPYLGEKKYGFADSALRILAELSVQSEAHAKRTFDVITPLLDGKDNDRKLSAIIALGLLGEKYVDFAQASFDAAKHRTSRGNGRYMRAYATGVIGAVGAAHPQFREEAVALVKGVALTEKEDGTVRDVAFSALVAIGAADDKYAEQLFAWAKEQSAQADTYGRYGAGSMVGKIGLASCGRLTEARSILQQHFMAEAQDRYVRSRTYDLLQTIEKETGNDAEKCKVRLKENPKETNLPSGLMFTADDYSFQ